MGRSKPKRIWRGCQNPTCGADAYEIWFCDNHGDGQLLETHCNVCGWAIDGEGELRSEGISRFVRLGSERKG